VNVGSCDQLAISELDVMSVVNEAVADRIGDRYVVDHGVRLPADLRA
jgi:hypothetical protein